MNGYFRTIRRVGAVDDMWMIRIKGRPAPGRRCGRLQRHDRHECDACGANLTPLISV
jgi:hypothetical protein